MSFFTRNMAPLAPDLVTLLKRGGHFVVGGQHIRSGTH